MKLSTNAVALALAVAAQHAAAMDFDFRNFEGLWESVIGSISRENTDLGVFKCGATGDFLKAVCDVTFAAGDDVFCAQEYTCGCYPTSVLTGKFSLDQFDAETGETGALYFDLQCCGAGGCKAYPYALAAEANGLPQPLASQVKGPTEIKLRQVPGKNANNIRGVEVVYPAPAGSGISSVTDLYMKTAGGFKPSD